MEAETRPQGLGQRAGSGHNQRPVELESDGVLFCFSHLPRIYQAFLMSATFNEDVQTLKELVLHNPVSALCRHLEQLTRDSLRT